MVVNDIIITLLLENAMCYQMSLYVLTIIIMANASDIIFVCLYYSKDDRLERLPNLDATQQGNATESNEEVIVPTRERKHFRSNITKTGYAIFSVSYS